MLVSVIIPVRDAEAYLPVCLAQLRAQTYRKENLELIIVDGQSRDRTVEVATNFDLGGISRQIIQCPTAGRSQGLNFGIKAARGQIICRLDARTRIDPNYISLCVETLESTAAANVGGLQIPEGHTDTQLAIGLAMSHPFGVGNAQFRIAKTSGFVDTVYLGCFRREIFDKVGWFDESAGVISEDSDMNQRIRAAGETVYLNVEIRARYAPREKFREQAALYFRYGGARAGNVIKHRRITSFRQLAAPVLVASAVLLAIGALWVPALIKIGALGASAYVLSALIAGYSSAAKIEKLRLTPLVALAFPLMHTAYGLGFWCRVLVPASKKHPWKA